MADDHASERFLDEAVSRGALTAEQAADCRRLMAALGEVEVTLSAADVAQRKGYLDKAGANEIKRALARRRVGKYEVLDRLGSGGTGVVWRARDVRLGRTVALKVLAHPPEARASARFRERFLREARTAVTLNHVNIVRGIDCGESDGYCFFAMELVPGESMASRLSRAGRIGEPEALRVALDVVAALEYVQRFRLVHRDIKPANLLVTPNGVVKVCDFGLARPSLADPARAASAGTLAGTPAYMAPEQIRDPDAVDWRADQYALGATLYHLLTGRPPFVAERGVSVVHRHLTEAVSDPREHVLELGAGAASVVLKMLEKDASQRYATLADLAADLSSVVEGRPPVHALELRSDREGAVAEILADQGARARLRPQRHRRLGRVAAAALVAALIAGGWWTWDDAGRPTEHAAVGARAIPRDVPGADTAPDTAVVDAAGPVPSAPLDDPGAEALTIALKWEDSPTTSPRQVIDRYEWLAEKHAAYPSGKRAAERYAILWAAHQKRARADLSARQGKVEAFLERNDFRGALAVLEAFPREFDDTDAWAELDAQTELVGVLARQAVDALLAQARRAATEREFERAIVFVREARDAALDERLDAVDQEQANLSNAARAFRADRRSQAAHFRSVAGDALLAVHESGVESALSGLRAAAVDRTLDAHDVELAHLEEDVLAAAALSSRVRAAWRELGTVELSLRSPAVREFRGTTGGVQPDGRFVVIRPDGEGVERLEPLRLPADLLERLLASDSEPVSDAGRFLYFVSIRDFESAADYAWRLPGDAPLGSPAERIADVRAAAERRAQPRLDDADDALRRGALRVARQEIDRALEYLPEHSAAFVLLGRLHGAAGRLDMATQSLERALAVADPDPNAHLELARLLARRDRLADSEAHYALYLDEVRRAGADESRVALAERERQAVADQRLAALVTERVRAARSALRAGRKGDALALFERVLADAPSDPDALFQTGQIYHEAGRLFDAYRSLRAFVGAHPDHARSGAADAMLAGLERFRPSRREDRALAKNGRGALDSGLVGVAIRDLRAALRGSPFLREARLDLARALLRRARLAESRDDLVAALRASDDALLLADEFPNGRLVRGLVRIELGDLDGARADAEAAASGLSDNAAVELLAGRVQLHARDLDAALVRFERAADLESGLIDAVYWQALVHHRQGHGGTARSLIRRIYDEMGGAPKRLQREIERLAVLYPDD